MRPMAAKLAGQLNQDPRRPRRSARADELTEMTGIDADRATQLITNARAHWFE